MPAKTKGKNRRHVEESFSLSDSDMVTRSKDQVNLHLFSEIKIAAKNESQRKLIKSIQDKQITICAGLPGSGKTFVALGMALKLLKEKNNPYKRIYIIKSVTTLKGEEVGFLKGDLNEKIEPFMWSFFLNVEKLVQEKEIRQLFTSDIIRPFPLAYIRGATLDNCIVVVDEAQNITMDNARTILTRIGENCKMILLGDTNQIDLKTRNESSLQPLLDMFPDNNEIGTIVMDEKDASIRNPLINDIEAAFKQHIENTAPVQSNKRLLKG